MYMPVEGGHSTGENFSAAMHPVKNIVNKDMMIFFILATRLTHEKWPG